MPSQVLISSFHGCVEKSKKRQVFKNQLTVWKQKTLIAKDTCQHARKKLNLKKNVFFVYSKCSTEDRVLFQFSFMMLTLSRDHIVSSPVLQNRKVMCIMYSIHCNLSTPTVINDCSCSCSLPFTLEQRKTHYKGFITFAFDLLKNKGKTLGFQIAHPTFFVKVKRGVNMNKARIFMGDIFYWTICKIGRQDFGDHIPFLRKIKAIDHMLLH